MKSIDCPERMIEVIREYGIIPFFRGAVPGWSIEEMTAPECWFGGAEDDELGPWDWKIEVVREGDIAYGKFLGGKSAFATVEWYRDLMNWRRSIPKYRMALGEKYKAVTNGDKLMKHLSPVALSAIKEAGALEARELRQICTAAVTPAMLRALGPRYKPLLSPNVKKNIVDSVVQFLQMGTWSVIGDIQRVYRGADLHYNGWQRASNTTPDNLFGGIPERTAESQGETTRDKVPVWARMFEEETEQNEQISRSPEESRKRLISHIIDLCPEADEKALLKMV